MPQQAVLHVCQVCGCVGERGNPLLQLRSGGETCLACANKPAL